MIDPLTGMELVDDWSLPKEMMILHRVASTDTHFTVLKTRIDTTVKERCEIVSILDLPPAPPGALGYPDADTTWQTVRDTTYEEVAVETDTLLIHHEPGDYVISGSGKPMYDVSATFGLNQGAIRQLHAKVKALDPVALEARVTELEDQVDNLQTILILIGLAIGGGKAVVLVKDKGILKKVVEDVKV